jgi:predicted N-acetyltransferase YhbS
VPVPDIVPLLSVPLAAREQLLDAAFGPDRRAKTSYRLRAGTGPIADLSFAARAHGRLVGSLQSSPIALTEGDGTVAPMILVGPVAVAPDSQSAGIGTLLMTRLLADAGDAMPLVLIGDPDYYGRFGFVAGPGGAWVLPGPVERRRLLVRASAALPVNGELGPRR